MEQLVEVALEFVDVDEGEAPNCPLSEGQPEEVGHLLIAENIILHP
jgi:hypothetical protein